jgi:serine/threonine protein kinase
MQLRTTLKGETVSLDTNTILGTGGEAKVYAVYQKPNLVAKIYHKPTKKRAKKLDIMLANPPGDPMASQGHISIAWPVDLLETTDPTPKVIGFLMLNVSGMSSILNFYNPQIRRKECPLFNYKYLHRSARNLAAAVRAIHNRGYVIGDINESNILVSDSSLVTVVDTDSFQVTDPQTGDIHRCPVGKPEYTPPELQGITFAHADRLPQHDLFGLGVLIFQLLMEGFHPFTGVYNGTGDPPPIEDRIASGHFPYRKRWHRPYEPSPLSPDIDILHPDLKYLFMQCFETGHKKPKRRPDAQTWIDALTKSEEALVECDQNKQHLYGKHLRQCPWCERTQRLKGRDPFPSSQTIHKGLPKPIAPAKQKAIDPLKATKQKANVSSSSSTVTTHTPPQSNKWIWGLVLFFVGAWLLTKTDFRLPQIPWPKLPEISIPDTTASMPEPEKTEPEMVTAPEEPITAPTPDPLNELLNRFHALDNPKLSDSERLRLYPQFIADFYNHPDAKKYIDYVKDKWETMAFFQLENAFQIFQSTPTKETTRTLLETANAYLKTQSKRQAIATHTQHFAKWHLDTHTHPIQLVIDQGEKHYVKIIHNNNIYVETKKIGNFTAVTIPQYKFSDSLIIEGYRNDRFDDTKFDQKATINHFKGNHHLTLTNKMGTINIQVIFKDYPQRPQF